MKISTNLESLEASAEARAVHDLALKMWEAGDYEEAKKVLRTAILSDSGWLPGDALMSRKHLAMMLRAGEEFDEARATEDSALPLVKLCHDDNLLGKFYNGCAATAVGLGDLERAESDWAKSSEHHARACDGQAQSEVENNLAVLCIKRGDLSGARQHLANALGSGFSQKARPAFDAQTKDTQALILLAEGRTRAGLDIALDAVLLARGCNSEPVLEQTLDTLCTALRRWQHEREEARLRLVLESVGWKLEAAASKLKVSRQTLAKRLRTKFSKLDEERIGKADVS